MVNRKDRYGKYSRGILLKITNITIFCVMSLMFVGLPKGINSVHVIFTMFCFGIVGILSVIFVQKISLKTANINGYVVRSIFNVLGFLTWFKALQLIGINEATAISYMIPILTLLLSTLFTEERLNILCLVGVLISFFGMYVIILPNLSEVMTSIGSIFALFSAVMWALYDIVCKLQTKTEHYLVQTFYVMFFTIIILLPFILLDLDEFRILVGLDLLLVVLIGILSAINNTVLFLAYKAAPINILMPFSYLRLLIVAVANYLIFSMPLEPNALIGVVIISIASSFVFYEQYKGKVIITEK